ncbi:PepSY domain-containing protein [Algimonas porphyrae]|uniref:PepSY domain-containing protein n=1 Tax=Algimonas porphyrae TaxID=1128113 RepID=A0ABQ5UZ55_9PROT|nr:PepSY domain-containing protein [Algimonas porphyrae]GLQ19656.1 hypothetical protein GCM10007854_06110 [Algimonas porphyrae]
MRHMLVISTALLSGFLATPALAAAPASLPISPSVLAAETAPSVEQVAQRQISAREARAIALARVPGGEVVDIRRTRDTYRVRIIARDGRVVDIVVDANTGRIR